MNEHCMRYIWDHANQKGSALLLMLAIASDAGEYGLASPSLAALVARTRMSRRQTIRLVARLDEQVLDRPVTDSCHPIRQHPSLLVADCQIRHRHGQSPERSTAHRSWRDSTPSCALPLPPRRATQHSSRGNRSDPLFQAPGGQQSADRQSTLSALPSSRRTTVRRWPVHDPQLPIHQSPTPTIIVSLKNSNSLPSQFAVVSAHRHTTPHPPPIHQPTNLVTSSPPPSSALSPSVPSTSSVSQWFTPNLRDNCFSEKRGTSTPTHPHSVTVSQCHSTHPPPTCRDVSEAIQQSINSPPPQSPIPQSN
jgi:hypothetical protein